MNVVPYIMAVSGRSLPKHFRGEVITKKAKKAKKAARKRQQAARKNR